MSSIQSKVMSVDDDAIKRIKCAMMSLKVMSLKIKDRVWRIRNLKVMPDDDDAIKWIKCAMMISKVMSVDDDAIKCISKFFHTMVLIMK